jgi:hypothetical protein
MPETTRVWVEDRSWQLIDCPGKTCRFQGCRNPAVAVLRRKCRNGLFRQWRYCADHLYGRRIANGRVENEVSANSPAAIQGFCGGF